MFSLEDQSDTVVSVDTSCLRYLAEKDEQHTCPLEDPPDSTLETGSRCLQQLEWNLRHRVAYIPVTSYLAYAQRVNVDLCTLLVMMEIEYCTYIPLRYFEMDRVVPCYFPEASNSQCRADNISEQLCLISKYVILLKCKKYEKFISIYQSWDGREVLESNIRDEQNKLNTLTKYQHWANKSPLDYKIFKVETLLALEITLISLNIFFRFLTILVYFNIPQLRNVPGKALLTYQVAGLTQLFCSEVIYRFGGVPDIRTIVQLDSSLTLLQCVWLNVFCYEMLHCLRSLKLPDHLHITQIKAAYRRYLIFIGVVWLSVSLIAIVPELVSEDNLLYSRITFFAAFLLSITFNMTLSIVIICFHIKTRYFMKELEISSSSKIATKKQLLYLTAKGFILSGLGLLVRLGFQQAEGIAVVVYYVHLSTMLQGPILFVLFVCNDRILPVLRDRLLRFWRPGYIDSGQELCSSAERNLERLRQRSQECQTSTV